MSQTPLQATYPAGKTLRITMPTLASIDGKNYLFSNWENDTTDVAREVTLNSDMTLTATYLQTIALSVVASEGGNTNPAPQTYYYPVGPVYTFQALPTSGYSFDHWDLSGENKGSDKQLQLTIMQTMDGKTLTALFTQIPPQKIILNIAVSGNGTTDLAPGPHEFNVGDKATITATPLTGETFIQWTQNGTVYTTNPLELPITLDLDGKTLTANFTATTPTSPNYMLWILLGLVIAAGTV